MLPHPMATHEVCDDHTTPQEISRQFAHCSCDKDEFCVHTLAPVFLKNKLHRAIEITLSLDIT